MSFIKLDVTPLTGFIPTFNKITNGHWVCDCQTHPPKLLNIE